MNQHVFKFLTWGVVCSAVLSSIWLASSVSRMDLSTLEAARQGESSLIALPTEPTAAGLPGAPASSSAGRAH